MDLASADPGKLDFAAIEAADSKLKKHLEHWPDWVQQGMKWAQKALAQLGITVDVENVKDPVEYIDQLIALVKAGNSNSYVKFVVLAALTWLRAYEKPPLVVAALAKR